LAMRTAAPGGGPVGLEIVADGERSRFLVQTETKVQQGQLRGQVAAAYPPSGAPLAGAGVLSWRGPAARRSARTDRFVHDGVARGRPPSDPHVPGPRHGPDAGSAQ